VAEGALAVSALCGLPGDIIWLSFSPKLSTVHPELLCDMNQSMTNAYVRRVISKAP